MLTNLNSLFLLRVVVVAIAGLLLILVGLPFGHATKLVPQDAQQIRYSYAPLVKQIAPAVVNVYAARRVQQKRSPFASDPFFEQFFGPNAFGRRQQKRTARSVLETRSSLSSGCNEKTLNCNALNASGCASRSTCGYTSFSSSPVVCTTFAVPFGLTHSQ